MTDIDVSVGRIDGLETMLDCNFLTTNFTSLRKLTQLFCEMNGITMADIENYSAPSITTWCMEFLHRMRAAPEDTSIHEGYTLQPITISRLIAMEDALGTPIYGNADFDRISVQLKCVMVGYGLTPTDMAAVRRMPYPEYFAHIWMPLSAAMSAALSPPANEEGAPEEKNPSDA